jgi:histidyl-tRNA synthetase
MDYYNLTVFEWVTPHLGAQGTVCGGGRYDGLIEQLGGKPAPAVGWGLGIERLQLLLEQRALLPPEPAPDAYAVVGQAQAWPAMMQCLEALRMQGVDVLMHPSGPEGPGSLKSQFKRADASGARWALIFGEQELAQGMVALKPLRSEGEQGLRSLSDVGVWARELK